MSERIRVGTRGSKLALAQTREVVEKLEKKGHEVEIKIIKSLGDVLKDKLLHEFRGSGAFTRALDTALARGEVDVVVHSYKDVPSRRIEGTTIAAVLKRGSPYDAFVSNSGLGIEEIPAGSIIGTSSLRRRAQILRLRKDLKIENLRGNLDTRLRKLQQGLYDGIITAEVGLIRLGLDKKVKYQRLPIEKFVPSANQGIIAVATRVGEEDLVRFMNDKKTELEAKVERTILSTLGLGCAVPSGILATAKNKIELICEFLSLNGTKYIRIFEKLNKSTAIEDAKEIALNLRDEIFKSGLRTELKII